MHYNSKPHNLFFLKNFESVEAFIDFFVERKHQDKFIMLCCSVIESQCKVSSPDGFSQYLPTCEAH